MQIFCQNTRRCRDERIIIYTETIGVKITIGIDSCIGIAGCGGRNFID